MLEISAQWLKIGFYALTGGLLLLAGVYVASGLRHGGRSIIVIITSLIFSAGVLLIVWQSTGQLNAVDWGRTFPYDLPQIHWINSK